MCRYHELGRFLHPSVVKSKNHDSDLDNMDMHSVFDYDRCVTDDHPDDQGDMLVDPDVQGVRLVSPGDVGRVQLEAVHTIARIYLVCRATCSRTSTSTCVPGYGSRATVGVRHGQRRPGVEMMETTAECGDRAETVLNLGTNRYAYSNPSSTACTQLRVVVVGRASVRAGARHRDGRGDDR